MPQAKVTAAREEAISEREAPWRLLKETAGGEFRVYRASIRLP